MNFVDISQVHFFLMLAGYMSNSVPFNPCRILKPHAQKYNHNSLTVTAHALQIIP